MEHSPEHSGQLSDSSYEPPCWAAALRGSPSPPSPPPADEPISSPAPVDQPLGHMTDLVNFVVAPPRSLSSLRLPASSPPPDPGPSLASERAASRALTHHQLRNIVVPDMRDPYPADGTESDTDVSEAQLGDDGQAGEYEPRSKRRRGHRRATVWVPEVHNAFLRAVHLIPNFGGTGTRRLFDGKLGTRSDVIGEYIRRQTGQFRDRVQVNNHLTEVRRANSDNLPRDPRSRALSQQQFDAIDWSALLGPDLFPNAQPTVRKRRKDARRPIGGFAPSRTPRFALRKDCVSSLSRQRASESEGVSLVQSSSDEEPLTLATITEPVPAESAALPSSPSAHVDFSSTVLVRSVPAGSAASLTAGDARGFLPSLVAFLTAVYPARDHSLAARALLDSGVDSVPALVDLLALEQSVLESFFELVRSRAGLGGLEMAWLKRVVSTARDECQRAG